MKKQLLMLVVLLIGVGGFIPNPVLAFSCLSNGVSIGGEGTYTVPIDVQLDKTTNNIVLTDMSTYTSCRGQTGYTDALRTTSASISPILTGLGYTGFAEIHGTRYNFPIGMKCIWPDSACSTDYPNLVYTPVNVKIGMQRLSAITGSGTSIPAGTEIARLQVQQRSNLGVQGQLYWQWGKTWIFTLKNTLVVPAYTCAVNNPYQTVTLPPVKKSDLLKNGAGRYPAGVPFKINLTCDPQTTVSVKFDGTTMTGKTDVLGNTSIGNASTGIQVLFNNNPITFGQSLQVIANSQAQESLPFDAFYYYDGGAVSGGEVSSVATFTLTYN